MLIVAVSADIVVEVVGVIEAVGAAGVADAAVEVVCEVVVVGAGLRKGWFNS